MKRIGDLTVNDGKGFLDNEGMCDSIMSDVNTAVKLVMSGQYVQFCGKVFEICVKLGNLKKAIRQDIESKNKVIEELKRINDTLVEKQTGLPVEKDGAGNGGN
jgi:hypothetical protein